jgi:hypothetical protein
MGHEPDLVAQTDGKHLQSADIALLIVCFKTAHLQGFRSGSKG